MGDHRAMQVIQHRTFLQAQGLDHGQHPLYEPAPRRAVTTGLGASSGLADGGIEELDEF